MNIISVVSVRIILFFEIGLILLRVFGLLVEFMKIISMVYIS